MQKKRISTLVVFLALLTAGCSGTGTPLPASTILASTTPAPAQASDVVFKTPEDAIAHYFEGLAQNDAHKIAEACAINEMSEKFQFELYTERVGYLVPMLTLSPTNYPFYVELNKTQLSSQIFNRVKFFAYSLLSSEEVAEGKPTKIDAERINRFTKDVDPKRLAQLQIKKIDLPNKTGMNSATYLENAARLALNYGADKSTERVALFSFEQNDYYLGFMLLRYGENWKISAQTYPLANTNPLGVPEKTTAEEFERMINGN